MCKHLVAFGFLVYSASGPSVAHYFSTPWAPLTAGEVPHPVQTCSLDAPSQNSTLSVVHCQTRRPQRVKTISVLVVHLCSRHSTYTHWTETTCFHSLWSGRLEQSATISTHHDLSLCFSPFAKDSLLQFSIFIMIYWLCNARLVDFRMNAHYKFLYLSIYPSCSSALENHIGRMGPSDHSNM